jgi:catalase
MHFQRDGHMQTDPQRGRGNYEPNSLTGDARGPRADLVQGYQSVVREERGGTRRLRAESFADHYSQARQFFISQTPVEQDHIIKAYTFELSKSEIPEVRSRILAHLRNVHDDLASGVAGGLGMPLPEAATPARQPITDLPPSDALSILKKGPGSFAGRKMGVLVTDGADAVVLKALGDALGEVGAVLEADQMIDGGPSVLYDAVVLLPGAKAVSALAGRSTAKDFVSDAFAHHKFIGYNGASRQLLEAAGVADLLDAGCVKFTRSTATTFVKKCGALRFWDRDVQP